MPSSRYWKGDRVRLLAEPTCGGNEHKWPVIYTGRLGTVDYTGTTSDGDVCVKVDGAEAVWMPGAKLVHAPEPRFRAGDEVQFIGEPVSAMGEECEWSHPLTGRLGTVMEVNPNVTHFAGPVRVMEKNDACSTWWMHEHRLRLMYRKGEPVGTISDADEDARPPGPRKPPERDLRGDPALWGIPRDHDAELRELVGSRTVSDVRREVHPPPEPPAGRVCPACGLTSCMHPRVTNERQQEIEFLQGEVPF